MIYDFSQKSNTYDANSYKKSDFASASCPGCNAVGRFALHGKYNRYIVYFEEGRPISATIGIKRVKCLSCGITHAVMPGDIIPYRLLSLFVFLSVLNLFYIKGEPALKIADGYGLPYQHIYSVLSAFRKFMARICQYYRELYCGVIEIGLGCAGTLALIREPYACFQSGYIDSNKRPCFMGKFFGGGKAPPVGTYVPFIA